MFESFKRSATRQLGDGLTYLPKWLSIQSIVIFVGVFAIISILWSKYMLPWNYFLVSFFSVSLFFYGSNQFTKQWAWSTSHNFEHKLFIYGFIIRLIWITYIFLFNIDHYGAAVGDIRDTGWYMDAAKEAMGGILNGDLSFYSKWLDVYNFDDLGYSLFLSVQYIFLGNITDVYGPFIIKSLLGSLCAIFIYRIGVRHFGESVGRMAGIFCMLSPHMIYWCGSMMKEAEMVFFVCWYMDWMDAALVNRKVSVMTVLPSVLVGLWLFTLRAALAVVAFMAVMATLTLSSSRMVSYQKKILAGLMVVIVLLIGLGGRLRSASEEMFQRVQGGEQSTNMQWRSTQEGGNQFAKYASATVFAPLIFTLPFPTLTMANEGQVLQMQMAGANYVKNLTSFFVIFALFVLLFSGKWRQHVFPLSFMCGYLLVLVMSTFAQSGRFHMPVIPFEMLFAAYGFSILTKRQLRTWYNYVLIAEIFCCFAWQWFKLKGRGMI